MLTLTPLVIAYFAVSGVLAAPSPNNQAQINQPHPPPPSTSANPAKPSQPGPQLNLRPGPTVKSVRKVENKTKKVVIAISVISATIFAVLAISKFIVCKRNQLII